jgi:D-amino-acid dehydrogenase
VDRSGVAAGASWGNAGWVAPALTNPLNQPAVLGYGLRSLTSPTAPLHIPLTADAGLWTFLARFAVNCRRSSWTRAVRANLPLNEECIEAFDVLTVNGVDVSTTDGPITAVFQSTRQAQHLLDGLGRLEDAGQSLFVTGLFGEALREQANAAAIKCPAARRCR